MALVSSKFKIFIVLFSLFEPFYAESNINFCSFGSEYVSGWIPTTLLVILTVITILSFLYSFSILLGSYGTKIKINLKEEYVQAAISILLISSIVLILKPSCDLLQSIGGQLGQAGDPFLQSELYLQSLLMKGINLYVEGYLFEIRFLILGKFIEVTASNNWGKGSVKIGYSGGALSGPFVSMLNTIDQIINLFITVAYSTIYFLLLVLQFTQLYAFQLLLPMAILLRAIPPIRRGADFFIALSIGLYIFFPALLLLNSYIFSNVNVVKIETPQSAKDLQTYLSDVTQTFNANSIGLSALEFWKVYEFNQFLQEIAWYDFLSIFLLGMDMALVTTFVETLGAALSSGFGSLTTRLREAYAPG
jgi:hypothetical protein